MARPNRPSSPPVPPSTAAEAAPHVRQFVVKLFDRQDGEGVNWRMIAETLFLAAFDVLDKLPDDQKQAVARRVHEGSYRRMTGDPAPARTESAETVAAPSNAGAVKAARPRPPR